MASILAVAEDGFERVVDGVERTTEFVEQAIDDATRSSPAKVESSLSDRERGAAVALFWHLVREQGGNIAGATAMVYEDAAMVLCLQRLDLVDGSAPAASFAELGYRLRELAGKPAAPSVLRRLHVIPVGRWLKADPGRRSYSADEWVSLIQHLQSPLALVEAPTIPPDNPLPVSALLQIPARELLVCGCGNDSTFDRVEQYIDGPTSTPTAAVSCSKPSSSVSAAMQATASAIDAASTIRPLGALMVWRWPTAAALAASNNPEEVDAALRRAHLHAGGGVMEGSALLQAFTPLATAVQCLAYCTSRNLIIVGSHSGALQLYSLGARGALHYRYAIDAHASPILSLALRPHPARIAGATAEKSPGRAYQPPPPIAPAVPLPVSGAGGAGRAPRSARDVAV